VPADSISEYVQLLLREACGDDASRGVVEVKAVCFGTRSVSGGSVSSPRAMPPAGNAYDVGKRENQDRGKNQAARGAAGSGCWSAGRPS
jgi:hypothetical protein